MKNEKDSLFYILSALRDDLHFSINQLYEEPGKIIFNIWQEKDETDADYIIICKLRNKKYYYILLDASDVDLREVPQSSSRVKRLKYNKQPYEAFIRKEINNPIIFSPNPESFIKLLQKNFK